jgi:hypothetical protein
VLSLVSALTEKYQIISDETIALNYRGTDKHTEIKIWPPEDYWSELQPLIDANPNCRILIQTDQRQVREYFVEKLGSRCFFFDELPVTEGDLGIHKILDTSKMTFGLYLLAMVIIMARCKYLITHTGNVAYWTLLYRGNSNNVRQFYV